MAKARKRKTKKTPSARSSVRKLKADVRQAITTAKPQSERPVKSSIDARKLQVKIAELEVQVDGLEEISTPGVKRHQEAIILGKIAVLKKTQQ